nr:nucleolar GTP-binding protein 2 [Paratrimastix eleionoma]
MASTNANRPTPDHIGRARTPGKIKYLAMLNDRPIRDKWGNILHQTLQDKEAACGKRALIAPDRTYFENTGVLAQKDLQRLQAEFSKAQLDPRTVLLKQGRIPMGLIRDTDQKAKKMQLLTANSFSETFGPKAQRKRPRLNFAALATPTVSPATAVNPTLAKPFTTSSTIASTTTPTTTSSSSSDPFNIKLAGGSNEDDMLRSLVQHASAKNAEYNAEKDTNIQREKEWKLLRHSMFDKGQSKRIWNELYKVVDSSDVVAEVLDIRDPQGTRCRDVENYIKKNCPHKHLILILNKCDLVPTWATARWVQVLSREYPTIAFHASINNPFGKGALIQLFRQFSRIHHDKKNISVGFVGYPNAGKSSIINALMHRKVCKVAPLPGETKVWQFVSLMGRVFLIDCPGIVQQVTESETDIVLKGVVRIGNLQDAAEHIDQVLDRVKKEYLQRLYKLEDWTDSTDFLTKVCKNSGRLLKGGEPDLNTAAKVVLNDWQRGRIPYFVVPDALVKTTTTYQPAKLVSIATTFPAKKDASSLPTTTSAVATATSVAADDNKKNGNRR